MSLEVQHAANIGKQIPSKNPIPLRKPSMKKSSSKVRGKEKKTGDTTYRNKGAGSKEYVGKTGTHIYEGEVIEPSALPKGKNEPEIYDAEIVETPKAISGKRAIGYSPVTKQPSTKKKKPGYTQPTLPGMRNTRQFKGINGPSS
jgi:hypothetical protein